MGGTYLYFTCIYKVKTLLDHVLSCQTTPHLARIPCCRAFPWVFELVLSAVGT